MANDNILKGNDWRSLGFDKDMSRPISSGLKPTDYLPGANFDVQLDELSFNRVIQFKRLDRQPQGSVVGKTYYDKETGQIKVWVGGDAKWADIQLTTTSTSTTSSSSSSSSTSTTI
jgi:hypothetical protein